MPDAVFVFLSGCDSDPVTGSYAMQSRKELPAAPHRCHVRIRAPCAEIDAESAGEIDQRGLAFLLHQLCRHLCLVFRGELRRTLFHRQMRRIHDALARGPLRQFRARNLAAGNLVECERQVKPGTSRFVCNASSRTSSPACARMNSRVSCDICRFAIPTRLPVPHPLAISCAAVFSSMCEMRASHMPFRLRRSA